VIVTQADAPSPRSVTSLDFEFRVDPGGRPFVWCLAVYDVFIGKERVYWRDELLQMLRPPFDIGPDTAVIAFYASAEWGCFAELGWQLPAQPIDLFAEVRVAFNRHLPKDLRKPGLGDRWGLYDALDRYELPAGDRARKDAMRDKAKNATLISWTESDKRSLMFYCLDDARRAAELFLSMQRAGHIDWPQARLRGLYTEAVGACIEHTGMPIDGPLFRRLISAWEPIKARYIREIEVRYGYAFHIDGHFNQGRFMDWLASQGIPWLFTDTGAPKLDDDTFREMERHYPSLKPLRRLFSHILDMKVVTLPVGTGDRNRCLSSVFSTATGRTMPSPAKHIWGLPRWTRGLLRPPEGYGIAILDWKAQEYAITGARSGDARLIADYVSGEPYMAFGINAGLATSESTSEHPRRGQFKVVCLAIPYGGTEKAIGAQLNIPEPSARHLVQLHKSTYPAAHRWIEGVVYEALAAEVMSTRFGWKWRPVPFERSNGAIDFPSPRSIRNFYCQGDGADMMRGATLLAWQSGVTVCATMHDALMIIAPLTELDDAVAITEDCMVRAGEAICGFDLKVDKTVVRWPDRYMDKDGRETWERTMKYLTTIEKGTRSGAARNPLP
jgi:hypothetical protein